MSHEQGQPVAITVVVPCLNEERAIGSVVVQAARGIAAAGLEGQVLVVDNGSTDASVQQALAAGAEVIHEPKKGYGNAVRRGIADAAGQYIVMADGDGTYPVNQLKPFVDRLNDGCDLVLGNRFGGIQPGSMTWSHRYVGTPILSLLIRLITRSPVIDSQSGMRAFRASAVRSLDLRSPGMEFASEMLLRAAQDGLRISEVDISFASRVGESKLQTVPDGWRHLRYLLAMSPDYVFVAPGLLLLAAALVFMVIGNLYPAGLDLGSRQWQPRFAALITGALGAQLLWFGFLAKIFLSTTLLRRQGWVVDRLTQAFTLERALAVATALLLAGGLIEVAIGLTQLGAAEPLPGLDLGLLGAFFLIVGGQSFFGSFLAFAITSEYVTVRRPSPALASGVTHELPVGSVPNI
ncbi:MAG TPA: glycosyltransferase family 2 protein [Chloroflexota bacterium]|nr:glycosyltransferase family 2 protein [Chloroflexota bacterium]